MNCQLIKQEVEGGNKWQRSADERDQLWLPKGPVLGLLLLTHVFRNDLEVASYANDTTVVEEEEKLQKSPPSG